MSNVRLLKIQTRRTPEEELATAVDGFLQYCRAKNLSPNTITYYRQRLGAFTRFLATKDLALAPWEVTVRVVRDFLTAETERGSATTAHHARIALCAFYRFLVNDGIVEQNPMSTVENIRRKRAVIDTFTTAQVETMLATCDKGFAGVRDRTIILTLLDCGLRVSELCGLSVDDIDWNGQTMLVLGKGNKERLVPFGNAVRQALLAYAGKRGELENIRAFFVTCYGKPIDRFRVREVIEERGKLAKITNVRCSPHTFRHTFAIMYLRNGGDVFSLQKLLGHTDLTMTRRYAELSQTDVMDKHRQFSPGDRFAAAVKPTEGRKRLR